MVGYRDVPMPRLLFYLLVGGGYWGAAWGLGGGVAVLWVRVNTVPGGRTRGGGGGFLRQ